MANPTRVRLRDTFVLDTAKRTADGYLTASAKVARTGTQTYQGSELGRPDLGDVILFRPENEVFNHDAMHSMAHRPVTLTHPPEMVDAKNWSRYAKGQTGDEVVRDGDCIRVPMVLMDHRAIDAVLKDNVRELSMGYTTELDWTPGTTPSGEKYDAVQTNIRGNHLAVVPAARGGSNLRIGDGSPDDDEPDDDMKCAKCGKPWVKDAKVCDGCGSKKMIKDSTETRDASRLNDKGKPMHTIMFDGHKLEVADELTGSTIAKRESALVQRIADAETAAKAIADALETEKKAHTAALAAVREEVSAKDGEIAVLKKQVADSALTPDKLDALIADRAAVIDAATPMLEKDFVFAGKTIDDIRKAAVTAKLGVAEAKELDAVGIRGAFKALAAIKTTDGTSRLAGALSDHNRKTHDASKLSVADAAYAEMIKEMQAGRSARN